MAAMAAMAADAIPERYALVICDAQPDLLNSLVDVQREELLRHIRELLEASRRQKWLVVFTGLRFKSGYVEVPRRHRIFGGLQRMNAAQGDQAVHWFMEGFQGSEIVPDLSPQEDEPVLFRQRMRHDGRLIEALKARNVTKVALCGLKTGQGLLAAAELLADEGLLLYVARECVADDKEERGEAVLRHVLPHLADVLSFEDLKTQLAHEIMMDMFVEFKTVKRAG